MNQHDEHLEFASAFKELISQHFVSRREYDKLKRDFDLLLHEHARSKELFDRKLEEWNALKQTIGFLHKGTKESAQAQLNMKAPNQSALEETPHAPKAPRLDNKASKRLLMGGDTPPGFWSTRFTPET